MEDHVMSAVIDNLSSKEEYNIYVNEYIRDEKLCELASLLEKEDDNLETYFNTRRYKSKFLWVNILYTYKYISNANNYCINSKCPK